MISIVVWLGDFNFRSDTDSPSAKELAKSGNYEALLAFDQVPTERDGVLQLTRQDSCTEKVYKAV